MQPYVPILRSPSPTPNPLQICATGVAGLVGRQLCQYLLSLGHSVVALDILPAESPRQRVKVENMKGYTYVVGSAEDYEVYGECVKGVMGLYILQQSIRDWKGL